MKNKQTHIRIIKNKHANYQYFITQTLEAGILLSGWEVKSIRAKKIEINNGYIIIKNNKEAFLCNTPITPLSTLSLYTKDCILKNRKLLLKKNELYSLFSKTQKKKCTIVPLELYWKNNWIKIIIGVAIGKKKHDKRMIIKTREWKLDKKNILN